MVCGLCTAELEANVSMREHLNAAHAMTFELYEQITMLLENQVELVELVPWGSVTPDPANANTHPRANIEAIKNSIVRFRGQITPAVVVNGVIYKGNGTHQAVRELFEESRLPSAMVRNGQPLFKIVRRDDFTPTEAVAYGITDNQTGKLSEWDYKVLGGYFRALADEGEDMQALGWKQHDIETIVAASEQWKPADIEELPDRKDGGGQEEQTSERKSIEMSAKEYRDVLEAINRVREGQEDMPPGAALQMIANEWMEETGVEA